MRISRKSASALALLMSAVVLLAALPACATAPSGVVVVTCKGKQFNPAILTVKEGTTVRWVNDDDTAHTITSANFTVPASPPTDATNTPTVWNSNPLNPGDTFEHKFDKAGSFPYACLVHPYMEGTVTVQPK